MRRVRAVEAAHLWKKGWNYERAGLDFFRQLTTDRELGDPT